MTNNEYKLATYTPVHITGETIDFILRELGSEALALYTAYAGIVQWQQTTTVKATTSFMAQRMKWSEDKVRKIKKLLVDNQYIEDIRKKDENHKIKGWYIQINYIVKSQRVGKARGWEKPEYGKKGGQVLYKESSSALERKESALKESKVLISEVETSQEKGTNEISQIIELFKEINPALNYGNKTQRKACEDMIKKFGFSQVMRMTKQVIGIQGMQYAPRATTPYLMYQKLGDFMIYFKEKRGNNKILDLTK